MYSELIGQILLHDASLTEEQLATALSVYEEGSAPRRSLGQVLVEEGFVTTEELGRGLAKQWNIPFVAELGAAQMQPELVQNLPLEFLKHQYLLPIKTADGQTAIAVADPLNLEAYDAVLNRLGEHFPRVVSTAEEIEQAIGQCYYQNVGLGEQAEADPWSDESQGERLAEDAGPEDLLNIANKAPVIKMVNTLFFKAVNSRASDIHIEPYEKDVKVRFRVDGVLHDVLTLPKNQTPALVSRVKIMANLDIAERRLPQDGQSRIKIGEKEMDIRCSVIPTSGGERVVLRLLDKGGEELGLDHLGFTAPVLEEFRDLIHRPHGIILITGPTGSGKTTTLYAALCELKCQERNILTVEDPIEYQLPGVGQMQIKPKIGLTFANCLKHILRQDPDVIMVGEIRDEETARVAVQSSLTGHLVLSTLHTNDSASAVGRLLDMDIEPYLIASSLSAIMAQRLVRVICSECKTACAAEQEISQPWKLDKTAEEFSGHFYSGTGCDHCLDTGYRGRTSIFEFLVAGDDIRELIGKRAAAHVIKETAMDQGMMTLRDNGLWKAFSGATTLAEVLRVTQDEASPIKLPEITKGV